MAAIIYSISRLFATGPPAGTPAPNPAGTGSETTGTITDPPKSSTKTRPRTTPAPETRKKPIHIVQPIENELSGSGKVTHRISRSRVRPPSGRNRHPFHLSRSPDQSFSTTVCSSSSSVSYSGGRPSADSLDSVVNFDRGRGRSGHFIKYPTALRPQSGSHSRDHSKSGRRIMWEDSGYDSPSLRTDSRHNYTGYNLNRSVGHGHGYSPDRYDTLKSRAERSVHQHLRSSIRSQQSAPQQDSAGSKLYSTRNSRSEGGLRGLSPNFTSTPIKESTTAVYQLYAETESHHQVLEANANVNPETLLLNTASSFQQLNRQTSATSILNTTSSTVEVHGGDYDAQDFELPSSNSAEVKEMFDETMDRILEDGNCEFDEKYGRWIQQVFQLQLGKMQSRLTQTFISKLDSIVKTKEQHFTEIQRQYRNKLLEFEAATQKFQSWIDTLSMENERLKESKDAVISELQHREANLQQNFQLEMDKQANEIQAEYEKEQLKIQRKHADQLRAVSDKYLDQVAKLEEQYQRQVESLQKLVTELKAQIIGLETDLEYAKSASSVASIHHTLVDSRSVHSNSSHHEREQMFRLIIDLRQKLAEAEREKTVLTAAHNEEVAELQAASDSRKKHMTKQMAKSQTILQKLEADHQEELAELTERLQEQEKTSQAALDELRQTYGTKINELTATVEGLRRKQFSSFL